MNWRPSVYPLAEKMSKDIARTLGSYFLSQGYDMNHWIIDFIESIDGITYFLQVKSFKYTKTNIGNLGLI